MQKISLSTQNLWAKKFQNNGVQLWLPLITHLEDGALLAKNLWRRWVSDGVKESITSGINNQSSPEKLFIFLVAVHDLGKATPVFQAKKTPYITGDLDERIEEKLILSGLPMKPYSYFKSPQKTPHALATQLLLEKAGYDRNISVILGSHHGKPPDYDTLKGCAIDVYPENFYLKEQSEKLKWSCVQQEIIDLSLNLSGFSSRDEIPIPNMPAQVLLSGLVIMTDWIVSNEKYFPYISPEKTTKYFDMKKRNREADKNFNLPYPWYADNTWMSENFYKQRFEFVPSKMQSAVVQTADKIKAPGIVVLESPMGSGKTEAALAALEIFAYKTGRTGLFFALPTQATSNGIFPRILKWINKLDARGNSVNLFHAKSQFNETFQSLRAFDGSTNIMDENISDGKTAEEHYTSIALVHEWFEGTKKSMLSDFVVGTIDQLLLMALKQKHVMLRHLGLSNKVVIIDECHAYDAYMSQYLEMALSWLGAYKVPVIVLSATLPAEKRQNVINAYLNRDNLLYLQNDPLGIGKPSLVNQDPWTENRSYPLITFTDGKKIKQEEIKAEEISKEVHITYLEDNKIFEILDDLLCEGGCAGIIVNTVKKAQNLAQTLSENFGRDVVKLLHSRFLTPDRIKKESKLLEELGKPVNGSKRPYKQIVVGTQVLEQSLDIDFDILITDICPMDLLVQRIGRLHRHERARPQKLKEALCFVTSVENDGLGFERESKKVYGEYLLMRTKTLLPKKIILPEDIPELVQNAYDNSLDFAENFSGYRKAKDEWKRRTSNKETYAKNFRIPGPELKNRKANLVNWLKTDVSDSQGEAAVRDTDESIEVLLVQEKESGRLHFLPWIENGQELNKCEVPSGDVSRKLACQSVRLPYKLCHPGQIDETIEELEKINAENIPLWQQSPWLRGSLFLILDKELSANLCGYRLTYNPFAGLITEKQEGEKHG